jgi:hypothetical protein
MQHPNEPAIALRGCSTQALAAHVSGLHPAKAISAIWAPKAGNVACGYLSLRSRQTTRPSV